MARLEDRLRRRTTFGVVASAVSLVGAAVALVIMLQKWSFQDNVIDLGHLRTPIAAAGLLVGVVCGIAGFVLSLEGASGLTGPWRRLGWVGFWLGAIGGTVGLVLGACYCFLKI